MGKWIDPGMFCTSVTPHELDPDALVMADVKVLQSREPYETHILGQGQYGEIHMSEPISSIKWNEHIRDRLSLEELPLLQDVIAGKAQGRTRDDEIAVFYNTPGMGVQFAASAARAFDLARKKGLGREIKTEWLTQSMRTG